MLSVWDRYQATREVQEEVFGSESVDMTLEKKKFSWTKEQSLIMWLLQNIIWWGCHPGECFSCWCQCQTVIFNANLFCFTIWSMNAVILPQLDSHIFQGSSVPHWRELVSLQHCSVFGRSAALCWCLYSVQHGMPQWLQQIEFKCHVFQM